MSDTLVYAAAPERVLAAIALLEAHGVACRTTEGSNIPWLSDNAPRHQLWVADDQVGRAREVLQSVESEDTGAAARAVSTVRWRLIVLGASALGFMTCSLAVIPGPIATRWDATASASRGTGAGAPGEVGWTMHDTAQWGALLCLVVLVLAFRSLRRSRPIARSAGAACAVLAAACSLFLAGCGDGVPRDSFSLGDEASRKAVCSAVLADMHVRHPEPAVLDLRTSFTHDAASWASCFDVVQAAGHISPALWRALPEVNRDAILLDPSVAEGMAPGLVVPRTEPQQEAVRGAGYLGPNEFTREFPGAAAAFSLSCVAFSPDGQQALLYAWRRCGPLCGDGTVYALARVGGAWSITFQSGLGAS